MQAHAPTLTARLLGDPMPGRIERSHQLRAFHGLVDVDPAEDRASRRDRIVDLLKAGPLSIRAISEHLKVDSGHVRNDVERLMAEGVTRRTGCGTGTHSNVLWHLAVDLDQAKAALAAKPKRSKFREQLARVVAHMERGAGYRPMELYKALGTTSQSMHDTLKLGLADGVLVKSGTGRGSTGSIRYHLAAGAQERAA